VDGTRLLDELALEAPSSARVLSLRRVIDALTFEIDTLANRIGAALAHHRGTPHASYQHADDDA
jgi:hypothetical protein